jgi:hypothetical protein
LNFFREIISESIINKIIPHLIKIIINEEQPGDVAGFIENLTYLNQTIKNKKFEFIEKKDNKIDLLLSLSKSNKEWDDAWSDFKQSHSIGKLSDSITNLFKKFKDIYTEKNIFNDDKIKYPIFSTILSGTYSAFFQNFMLKILEGKPGASERDKVWIILIQLDFIQEYLSLNYQTVKEFKMASNLEEINKSHELMDVDEEIKSFQNACMVLKKNSNLDALTNKLNNLYDTKASKEETEPIRNAIEIYNKLKLQQGAQYIYVVNAISDAIIVKLGEKAELENNIKQLQEKEKNMPQEQKEKEQELFSLNGKIKALISINENTELNLTNSQKLWIITEAKKYQEKKKNLEKEPEIREEELEIKEKEIQEK